MALPSRYGIDKKMNSMEGLRAYENGGKGSGNFGHSGRPGYIGGSGNGNTTGGESSTDGLGKKAEETKSKKAEIKGGTKAEREAFKKLGEDYYGGDDRGFQGIVEDARAAGLPNDTNYRKGERLVDGGSFATSSYDAYKDLKSIYGDNFKESTYVKKGGSAENGDWLMSGSDTYVWKTYRTKMAKMVADELDRETNSTQGSSVYKNGGKGSGNFGHGGRPGKVGGSGKGDYHKDLLDAAKADMMYATEKYDKAIEDGDQSAIEEADAERVRTEEFYDKLKREMEEKGQSSKGDKGFQSEYKVGDSYTKGGVTYDVVDGENGPHAVSKDGKISTELPDKLRHDQTKMIKDTFDGLRDEGVPMNSPRYEAARDTYKRIQKRAIETSRKGLDASQAPKMVREEVDRFLKQIEKTGPSKSVESYHKTASGILEGWAKGNGGLSKPQSSQIRGEVKELKAELDSLYERYRIMTTPKGFRKSEK